jgi:hypothetical protein
MKVKIRGGTVDHGEPSLCSSCSFAAVVKGARLGDEITRCGHYAIRPRDISFAVTSCSEYVHRAHPSIYQMEEIAWVLRSSPNGKKIGFVQARKLKDDEKHVLED